MKVSATGAKRRPSRPPKATTRTWCIVAMMVTPDTSGSGPLSSGERELQPPARSGFAGARGRCSTFSTTTTAQSTTSRSRSRARQRHDVGGHADPLRDDSEVASTDSGTRTRRLRRAQVARKTSSRTTTSTIASSSTFCTVHTAFPISSGGRKDLDSGAVGKLRARNCASRAAAPSTTVRVGAANLTPDLHRLAFAVGRYHAIARQARRGARRPRRSPHDAGRTRRHDCLARHRRGSGCDPRRAPAASSPAPTRPAPSLRLLAIRTFSNISVVMPRAAMAGGGHDLEGPHVAAQDVDVGHSRHAAQPAEVSSRPGFASVRRSTDPDSTVNMSISASGGRSVQAARRSGQLVTTPPGGAR